MVECYYCRAYKWLRVWSCVQYASMGGSLHCSIELCTLASNFAAS